MSAEKFTKGEWRLATQEECASEPTGMQYGWAVWISPRRYVTTEGRTDVEACANAHLIAAAPLMYSALERIVSEYPDATPHTGITAARAALARARGGSA